VLLALSACGGGGHVPAPVTGKADAGCLPGERGYLKAKFRGALESEPDWHGGELQCEGGARPDGSGLRVSFLGPPEAHGERLRLVFGIDAKPGTPRSRAVPTNITVIVEGGKQLYATQGADKCQVETMLQEPLPVPNGAARASSMRDYRIAARGACIDPASSLDGSARLYIDRFDFAGTARFADNELYAATSSR
jgi:hypothetical protein